MFFATTLKISDLISGDVTTVCIHDLKMKHWPLVFLIIKTIKTQRRLLVTVPARKVIWSL